MEESCLLWSSNCCWAAFPKWDETKSEDLIFRLHRDAHGERQTMPSTMLKLAAESPLNISYLFLRNLRAKLDLLLLSHLKYSFKTKKKKKCTFGNIYGWNTPQVYMAHFSCKLRWYCRNTVSLSWAENWIAVEIEAAAISENWVIRWFCCNICIWCQDLGEEHLFLIRRNFPICIWQVNNISTPLKSILNSS